MLTWYLIQDKLQDVATKDTLSYVMTNKLQLCQTSHWSNTLATVKIDNSTNILSDLYDYNINKD